MPQPASGGGEAPDATVQTGSPGDSDATRALRAQLADEAEDQVKVIEEKLDGLKQALADKKAEAKQLRAEAKEARG